MTKKVAKRGSAEKVDKEKKHKTVAKEHPDKEEKHKTVAKEHPDKEEKHKTVLEEHQDKKVVEEKDEASEEKGMTAQERDELLIENFVGLQHAMTNMSIKFGGLSDNISKLLHIFEESAKNFMSGGKPDDKEMLEKIDSLLNQNKTIAKGLVLMEGKLKGRSEGSPAAPPRMGPPGHPAMRPSMQPPAPSNPRPKPLPTL